MTIYKKILWYLFPISNLTSWLLFAGLFTDTLPRQLYLVLPLTFPFYFATLLFTVPANIFTILAVGAGIRCKSNNGLRYKVYYGAGFTNFAASVLWAASVFGFDWIITA